MTLFLLERFGIKTEFEGQTIKVECNNSPKKINQVVESDWSSASYIYSIVALSNESRNFIKNFQAKKFAGFYYLQNL